MKKLLLAFVLLITMIPTAVKHKTIPCPEQQRRWDNCQGHQKSCNPDKLDECRPYIGINRPVCH